MKRWDVGEIGEWCVCTEHCQCQQYSIIFFPQISENSVSGHEAYCWSFPLYHMAANAARDIKSIFFKDSFQDKLTTFWVVTRAKRKKHSWTIVLYNQYTFEIFYFNQTKLHNTVEKHGTQW